jgi:hypothetical protein
LPDGNTFDDFFGLGDSYKYYVKSCATVEIPHGIDMKNLPM